MFTWREDGFTLIELMIVILVIAVLIGVSVPTYLGARKRAQDAAAKTLARDALGTARTLFQVDESYGLASVAGLRELEPNIDFVDGSSPSTGPSVASTSAPNALTFVVAVYSKTGSCFWIRDVVAASGGTRYAVRDTDSSNCLASSPPTDPEFSSNWS